MDIACVRKSIASLLTCRSHDDGSYIPLFIRLAWHCCGTFDKDKGNGGSNGSTMRFTAEESDPENAGLEKAKMALKPIHDKYPWMSLAYLWILAGNVAIEASGGPFIRFSTGRKDFGEEEAISVYGSRGCLFGDGIFNPHKSRLPAADLGTGGDPNAHVHIREQKTIDSVRGTFIRMGFDDKETVCLILLGHQFGRCHPEVSGYEHP